MVSPKLIFSKTFAVYYPLISSRFVTPSDSEILLRHGAHVKEYDVPELTS